MRQTKRAAGSPADVALTAALDLLGSAGIPHALLREPGRDGNGVLEADVLVDPSARRTAEGLLAGAGFRRLPGWGRQPHRFLVRPVPGPADGDADGALDWLKLDLVADLAFGRWHQWATGCGAACLAAHRPDTGRLAPADELLARVLHVVLDRGEVRPDDAARLRDLAADGPDPGVLAATVLRDGATGATWSGVLERIRSDDWDGLLAEAPALARHLRADQPVRSASRHVRNRAARRLRPLLEGLAGRGPLVALVGPDGTGKTTLAHAVAESARLPTRTLYGGTYRSGTRARGVPGVATALVLGRLLATRSRVAWHRRRGRLVVLDRHPAEAGPVPGDALAPRTRARRRCLAASLPDPDLLVVLDAPAEVLHRRRPTHTVAHLERDRQRHLAMRSGRARTTLDASAPARVVRDRTVQVVWRDALRPRVARAGVARSGA